MELSITQQLVKGGREVFMVRFDGRGVLSFPLDMGGVANTMIDEALSLEEHQLPDLVQKYSLIKAQGEGGGLPNAKPVVIARPQAQPTDISMLAELLDCARQAEIQAHAAAEGLERATTTFTEAERRADLAWQAFNEALHAALPVGTRILGIKADD